MQTRITKLLEIEYPVIQGGMAWVANAALAANVSKAGGIGFTVVYRDSAGWRNCGGSDCGDAGGSVGDSKKNEEGIEGDDF